MQIHRHCAATLTLAVTVAVAASGCAFLRKTEYLRQETERFVFTRECPEVWLAARTLLLDEGYEISDAGWASAIAAETAWRVKRAETEKGVLERERYLLRATSPGPGRCAVQIEQQKMTTRDGEGRASMPMRDWGMEWRLIGKLEPERARQIERDAETATASAGGGAAAPRDTGSAQSVPVTPPPTTDNPPPPAANGCRVPLVCPLPPGADAE